MVKKSLTVLITCLNCSGNTVDVLSERQLFSKGILKGNVF